MAKKVVALYVDDNSLRLLVAGGREIQKWAELPLERGVVKDGVIVDEAAVISGIRKLFETENVTARKVVTGISGRRCLSRLITLPQLPRSLLVEAITREAERLLPVPLDRFYLSWQTLPGGQDEIRVFLIAYPQDATDALTKTLREAGIDPYLIDVKPLALARVVDQPTAIVADAQPSELDIVIIVDRIPQLIRTVSLPSEGQSRQKKLAVVWGELDRTIKFYNSSHEEQPLPQDIPVFASGELVKESAKGATPAGKLKSFAIPLLSPLKYHRALPPSRYIVNVGLVLKEVSVPGRKAAGSVVNLNASPQVYRPKGRSLLEMAFVPGIIIALASLALPITFVRNAAADTASLQSQLDVTNKRYEQAQLQKKGINELQEEVDKVNAVRQTFVQALEHFEQQHESVNNDLTTITSALSSAIELGNVIHIDSGLTVSGRATDETAILGYAQKLRASDRFALVIVSSIEKTQEGMNFSLSLIK